MEEEEKKETGSEGLQLNSKEDLIKLITDLTKRVDALTPQKEEKQEEIEHCKSNLGYAKQCLLKWMEKPENKDMILAYLEHHNIKIKEVN